MYLSGKCVEYKTLKTFVRLYSLAKKNHYDVLKLRKNCTDKEIKDAYIKMSKEFHPDKNKDSKAQEKFVQIAEAYNVLGKPSSRAQYDNMTTISSYGPSPYAHVYRPSPYNVRNGDYNFYYDPPKYKYNNTSKEDTSKAQQNQSYYGFEGLRKVPNYYIIGICVGITFIGVMLQVFVISELIVSSVETRRFRNMYIAQRAAAQEKSKKLAEELERVRATGRDNGNELQTRLLLDKIVAASNPTVTTASLGQALADEKKSNIDNLLRDFGVNESPEYWYERPDCIEVNLYDLLRKVMNLLD